MKFNLNTYLGMVKEAMAGKARRYRDHTDYTPLDNAIKGDSIAVRYGDESQTWAQLCEEIPSVQGVLNEALDFRERIFKESNEFKLSELWTDNEVKKEI